MIILLIIIIGKTIHWNTNAIDLIEKYKDKIDLDDISKMKHIFTYDYNKIKHIKSNMNEDIIKNRFHTINTNK